MLGDNGQLAQMAQYQSIYGKITSFVDLSDFVRWRDTGVSKKPGPGPQIGIPNTVELATDVGCDFQQMRYYTPGATDWPQRGDDSDAPLLNVPPTLYKRTIWLEVSAVGPSWYWQGRLVAKLGGMVTFQMPLLFASGGTQTRHSLSISWDQDNTGIVCEDKLQINDAAGNPLLPFSFVAAAQQISLEQDGSKIGTSDTRLLFACLSQSLW